MSNRLEIAIGAVEAKERNRVNSVGYWMSHKPGTSKNCFVCRKQKTTKGGTAPGKGSKGSKFICADCQLLMSRMEKEMAEKKKQQKTPVDFLVYLKGDDE